MSDELPKIDPVCLVHGKKMSEHDCLYCCLCFKPLTPEQCTMGTSGFKEDVCAECRTEESREPSKCWPCEHVYMYGGWLIMAGPHEIKIPDTWTMCPVCGAKRPVKCSEGVQQSLPPLPG